MLASNDQTENQIRIVCLSTSLANAQDLGKCIGTTPHTIFNFHPSVRPVPLEIHIQSYSIPHFASFMIVFMPSCRQCRLTAVDLLTFYIADVTTDRFLHAHASDIENHLKHVNDKALAETLQHGVGFYHEALSKQDKRIVEELFESGAIQVVITM